jgi:hypothetical protein
MRDRKGNRSYLREELAKRAEDGHVVAHLGTLEGQGIRIRDEFQGSGDGGVVPTARREEIRVCGANL